MPYIPKKIIINSPRLSPCYQCEDRVVGCHINCKEYKDYQKDVEKDREMRQAYYAEKIEKS